MIELDKCVEVFRTVEKMAKYLNEEGFDFVIIAKPIDPGEHQCEITMSCTNRKNES